jgi:soluble lytic murein transglycosylase-like protein
VSASRPERLAIAAAAVAFAALVSAPAAHAGAQRHEPLSAAIRATLAQAVSERSIPGLEDAETRAWIRAMHDRVLERVHDERTTRELLVIVRYEALRAGLDPRLVLAVIDVESRFRKYAVSAAGARGYMQVMPFWVDEIGLPGQNLFHPRINLRYGCVILRHYLRIEDGNLVNALGRYNGTLGRSGYPRRVLRAWRERWSAGH